MPNLDNIVFARKPMKYDHRDFRLSDYITPQMRDKASQMIDIYWPVGKILDQGSTPHCVGFAWAAFGISSPISDDWDNSKGHDIYYQAKIYDGEPKQENGSTTRSGVQAFMHFGVLENNAFAFAASIDEIVVWLLNVGPVITGTNWYSAMMTPDSNGLVKIGGYVAGGHEWMISGVDKEKRLFHCTNSWGGDWGLRGQFFISFDDYQRLFNEEGDAVTTTEIVGTPPTPEPTPDPVPVPPGCSNLLYKVYKWSLPK